MPSGRRRTIIVLRSGRSRPRCPDNFPKAETVAVSVFEEDPNSGEIQIPGRSRFRQLRGTAPDPPAQINLTRQAEWLEKLIDGKNLKTLP
jgi:hypothetical protein